LNNIGIIVTLVGLYGIKDVALYVPKYVTKDMTWVIPERVPFL
jgi:hypothetical protein